MLSMWENLKPVYPTEFNLRFLISLSIYLHFFSFSVCTLVSLDGSGYVTKLSHASSLITAFFLFFTGVDWERDEHSRVTKIKTKQNKIHKVQINELGVLMTTQGANWQNCVHQYHVIIFLFLDLFSRFFKFFCFRFSWKSTKNLNTPFYLQDSLTFPLPTAVVTSNPLTCQVRHSEQIQTSVKAKDSRRDEGLRYVKTARTKVILNA